MNDDEIEQIRKQRQDQLDQGWFEFARQLEYKSAWNGGEVIRVNPGYTSQTCSNCGYKDRV